MGPRDRTPPAGPASAGHEGVPEIDLDVQWEFPSAPGAGEPIVHALVSVAPRSGSLRVTNTGPVAHLVLALDVSASMNRPDKFPVLEQALTAMLRDLRATDSAEVRLSVVAFGRGAGIIVRDRSSRALKPGDLVQEIKASPLLFTNYTDVAGAIRECRVIVRDSHRADRRLPIRVVIMTDGRPQDVAAAEHGIGRLRSLPADVDCLCFGEDADVEVMKRLVCGGRGGTVKHVMRDSIEAAFGRIAEVAQRVVAKRALVDVELADGMVGGHAYRFRPGRHDFGSRAFEGGSTFSTDLGTLENGRTYSLLFQLRLPPDSAPETEVGRVYLRIPGTGGAHIFEAPLYIARHQGHQSASQNPMVRQAMDILGGGHVASPQAQLTSLRARLALHVAERRDTRSIAVIEHAIALLEAGRGLDELSPGERAVLQSHTRTVHSGHRAPATPLA